MILIVTGGKQSQLLALALGVGWSLTKKRILLFLKKKRGESLCFIKVDTGLDLILLWFIKQSDIKPRQLGPISSEFDIGC